MSSLLPVATCAITMLTALQRTTPENRHEAPAQPQLHKHHRATDEGIVSIPCDLPRLFDLESVPVTGIHELASVLDGARTRSNVAFVRGDLVGSSPQRGVRRLTCPRDGHPATLRSHPLGRHYVVIDIDGVDLERLGLLRPCDVEQHEMIVRAVVGQLPSWLQGVTVYYAWSQSAGLDDWRKGVRLHLACWLTRPVFDASLVENVSLLGGTQLRIDPQVFRPAQILYCAAPTFEGLEDPIASRAPRSGIIEGPHLAAEPPPELVDGPTWHRSREVREQQRLVELERSRRFSSGPSPWSDDQRRRYCEAALRSACDAIRAAHSGSRHFTIVREAFAIGGLVATGSLDADRARAELAAAARDCGSEAGERTAQECFEAGVEHPRDLSRIGSTQPPQPPDAPPPPPAGGGAVEDTLVEIIASHDLATTALAVVRALRNRGAQVFRYGDQLVVINRRSAPSLDPAVEGQSNPEWLGSSPLIPLTLHALLAEVALHTSWVRFLKGEFVPRAPDQTVLQMVLARPDWWCFPTLRGVVDMPTLRPDGTLLTEPGHDPTTQLFLVPSLPLPAVCSEPTAEDGRAAARLLFDLIEEFPFVDEHDRAAALAMLLTPVVRHAICGATPLFAVDATTRGTGKTTLARLAMLLSGDAGVSTTPKPDCDEWGKRIFAALRRGKLSLLFDNAATEVRSGDLDALLTAWPDFDGRVLGASTMLSLPATLICFVTGNNLKLAGDLARRTILCRLDARLEHPERRSFRRPEPERFVRDNRATLVAAALTLVRAYILHGDPEHLLDDAPLSPIGSYQAWSKLVREPVVWICGADPVANQAHILERSDDDNAWSDFLEVLEEIAPEGFLVKTLLDWLKLPSPLDELQYVRLRDTITCLPELSKNEVRDLSQINARDFGVILRSRMGRIFRGRRLVQPGRSKHGQRWRVVAGGAAVAA